MDPNTLLEAINNFTAKKQSEYNSAKSKYFAKRGFKKYNGDVVQKNTSQILSYITERISKLRSLRNAYVADRIKNMTDAEIRQKRPILEQEAFKKFVPEIGYLLKQRELYYPLYENFAKAKGLRQYFYYKDGDIEISVNLIRGKVYALPFAKKLIELAKKGKDDAFLLANTINKFLPKKGPVQMSDIMQEELASIAEAQPYTGRFEFVLEVIFKDVIKEYSGGRMNFEVQQPLSDAFFEYMDGIAAQIKPNPKYAPGQLSFIEMCKQAVSGEEVPGISPFSDTTFSRATALTKSHIKVYGSVVILKGS